VTVVALLVVATLLQGLLSCSLPFNFNWLKRHLLPFTYSNSVLGIVAIFSEIFFSPEIHTIFALSHSFRLLAEAFFLRFSLIPSGCWIVEENSQKWRNSPAPHGFHGFLGRPPVKAKKLLLQCPLSPPRYLFFLLKVKVFLFPQEVSLREILSHPLDYEEKS